MLSVPHHKTALMRHILDAASRGYRHYTSGRVPAPKALALYYKFADRYQVARNANQRAYAKRTGQANARVFLFPLEEGFVWWLMATPGAGVIHQLEQLRDVSGAARLAWPDTTPARLPTYELVQLPRPEQRPGWTWRMSRRLKEHWQARLRQVVRSGREDDLRQAIYSLQRVPGFRGCREDVKELNRQYLRDWQRCRTGEPPVRLDFVGWFRPKRAVCSPLDKLVRRRTSSSPAKVRSRTFRTNFPVREKSGRRSCVLSDFLKASLPPLPLLETGRVSSGAVAGLNLPVSGKGNRARPF